MEIIDAHQHFWNYNPIRDSWITEEMHRIRNNFLPQDLIALLQQNNVSGTVAVQADQSEVETGFLLELAEQVDFIKGVVGWVDLQNDRLEDRLIYYRQFKKLKGFRHVLQGEQQRDLMLTPTFKNGISKLELSGFTYDILIYPDQLRYIPAFAAAFPNQKMIIDHIAKPNIKEQNIATWKKDMLILGNYENLYCKISGLVTEANWQHWKQADFKQYLDVVVQTFGMKRILFGSDWPVCLVAAEYEAVIGLVKNYFSSFSISEQQQFFSENAKQFYNL